MLSAEDRLEIQALYARYCWAMDTGDVDAAVGSFAENGAFDANGVLIAGRDALRAWFATRFRSRQNEPTTNGQHWLSAFELHGDETSAHVRCYFMRPVQSRETLGIEISGSGWYSDDLRKSEGAWRFTKKVVSRQMPWKMQP